MLSIDEGVLVRAVDEGLSLGARYVEVRYQRDYFDGVTLRNDRVIGAEVKVSEGVGIRVLVDGSLGFASTNDLRFEGVLRAVRAACERARALAKLRRRPIEFGEERVGSASYSVVPKIKLSDLDIGERIRLGRDAYDTALKTVSKVRIPAYTYSLVTHEQEKLIITSDGAYIRSHIPRLYISLNIVLLDPQKGTIQRRLEYAGSGGVEQIKTWNIVDEVSREVRNMEKVLIEGVEPPKEAVDVVIGSEIVGLMVHESAGHPMEADRILGREAAQAGESYVKPDMVGSYRIGNSFATVIDDPTIPGSNGFYLYDDEGVPARPRYIYREGLVNEPLHNRHTARLFGTRSNGAARSMDYSSEPIIRMSNTYLKPGDMSFEELLEDISMGVYIKSYMEWNIDDMRWNQRYVGLEAYIIRNGEIAEPVRNPVLEISTKGFYSNIVAVDRNLRFYPGTCGKGEPPQGVPVWFGGPNVRISKIRLGVVA